MVHVMTQPRNALLKQFSALFEADGIGLHFTTDAVLAVAKQAHAANTGARGLRSIVENALTETMYHLPSWHADGVTDVLVTESTITDGTLPTRYLASGELYEPSCAEETCPTCPTAHKEPCSTEVEEALG